MVSSGHLDLNDFIFIGRTYDEYLRMFDLKPTEVARKRILDCPGGACSFTAHASLLGADVVAGDVLYELSRAELAEKGHSDLAHLRKGMVGAKDGYIWGEFGDAEGLLAVRQTALQDFLQDYHSHSRRYVPAQLPQLPFPDNEFDLVLSAHFLFCYAELMRFDLHLATIKELLRVAKSEVRIFPLVSNGGLVHPYLPELLEELAVLGFEVEIAKVPYEFQRGANEMLRITKL